jgi:hypothetical protein
LRGGAVYLVAFAVLLSAGAGVLAYTLLRPVAARTFAAGQWEVDTTLNLKPPAPEGNGPTRTTECLTEEDPAPRGSLPANCLVWTSERAGDTVKWRVHCNAPRQGDGVGTATFTGDTFTATLSLRLENGTTGAPVRFTETLAGHRSGPCPPQ